MKKIFYLIWSDWLRYVRLGGVKRLCQVYYSMLFLVKAQVLLSVFGYV